MIADIPQAVLSSPIAFCFGVIVGFVLSNRYKITRRNGSDRDRE